MRSKNKILVILFFLLPYAVSAQNACSKTIFNCYANLVNPQFADADIVKVSNISYAKPGAADIAPDASFANQCVQSSSCLRDGSQLLFDIYYPKPTVHNYNACALPVIFLIHPGGFSDCSNKNQPGMTVYSTEFAKRGFIVINVEYRRGHFLDPSTLYKSAAYTLAMYRAFQDLRGAVRSTIKMQLNGQFTGFRFDTAFIFLGGAGTTPMNVAYYNSQQMMDDVISGVKEALGPLKADYYIGDTTINYSIKGVLNLWGSVMVPLKKSFLNYFTQSPQPLAPLISFHGVLDQNSNYLEELIRFSGAPYNIDNTCLLDNSKPFILKDNNGTANPDMKSYGSQSMYDFFSKTLKVPTELYLDCNMHHGLDDNTGFGTGNTDVPAVQKYIVQRAVTFFQAVVNKRASQLNTTRFVDCENYRYACTVKNSNDSCNLNTMCPANAKQRLPEEKKLLFSVSKTGSHSFYINLKGISWATIFIYDANGKLIRSIKTEKPGEHISGTGISAERMYFIKVTGDKGTGTKIIYL